MQTDFVQFGPLHLLIIAAVPALAFALSRAPHWFRIPLGIFLMINEFVWYAYKLRTEGWRFPEGLPIQLCDLTLWLTVFALLTLNQWVFEAAYFLGVAGAGMAIIQPELWAPMASYPTMYFFVAHGGIVIAVLSLIWANLARPTAGCLKRVLIMLNGYAALVGTFNAIFHTNYMFLCRKPQVASLLDFFGPWPFYILAGEAIAMLLFALLYLPFRKSPHPQIA
jgi:hypothetical integral membrane protein (TIGR02206 family)